MYKTVYTVNCKLQIYNYKLTNLHNSVILINNDLNEHHYRFTNY